jgi:RNA polymerase sigma-70 factor (ECF subfamily)
MDGSNILPFPDPVPPAAPDAAGDEAAALADALRGDVQAFSRLYRQHVGQVYALCLRMTGQPALAEDCTQECFIAAWRALPGFEGRSRLGTWLHRIAVHAVLNERRTRSRRLQAGALDDEALAATVPSEEAGTRDVEAALARLPQGARDVLVLVGLHGHSHEEAATMLGIAIGTSKAQLHRGRRLLAAQLGLAQEEA